VNLCFGEAHAFVVREDVLRIHTDCELKEKICTLAATLCGIAGHWREVRAFMPPPE
jgi:hypothetical protein